MRKASARSLVATQLDTDHSFNSHRVALAALLVRWAAALPGAPAAKDAALAQSPADGEDEEAIRKVIAQTTKAFNDHDAVAFAGFYTPDADLVTVRGESMKGTAEIQRTLTGILQARAKYASLKPVDTRVRFLRPDVAVAHVINELSGLVDSEGRALPAHRELSIRVFVKEMGTWRVTAFHNTMLSPPSQSEPPRTRSPR
jgi:uncharacterized protein (TIGR02246 family)